MSSFIFEKLDLCDVVLIKSTAYDDLRGGFVKTFEKNIFLNNRISFNICEEFFSISHKNVLRGLHFQYCNPQAKLVTVLEGEVDDVIVDLRCNSLTYLKSAKIKLSSENHAILYIPKGFAHGFLSRKDNTIMLYMCDGEYDIKSDGGIKYDDNSLNIDWEINKSEIIMSDKDLNLLTYEQFRLIKDKDKIFG